MRISDIHLHAKHEFCGLDSFGVTGKCEVFTLSFGQTDRRTPVKQYAHVTNPIHTTNQK